MEITERMIEAAARDIADMGNISRGVTAEDRRAGIERTDTLVAVGEWHRMAAERALRAELA